MALSLQCSNPLSVNQDRSDNLVISGFPVIINYRPSLSSSGKIVGNVAVVQTWQFKVISVLNCPFNIRSLSNNIHIRVKLNLCKGMWLNSVPITIILLVFLEPVAIFSRRSLIATKKLVLLWAATVCQSLVLWLCSVPSFIFLKTLTLYLYRHYLKL